MKALISLLLGDLWKDEGGMWHSKDMDFRDGPEAGVPYSLRIPAAACEYKKFPPGEAALLLQGGCASDERPSLASVASRELMEMGVPEKDTVQEEDSASTYQQLLKLQEVALQKKPATIEILSSEWHLPRAAAMIECVEALSHVREMHPVLKAAEDILLESNPSRWMPVITEVHGTDAMKRRVEMERRGVEQIRAGTYTLR